jgi:hypothetical protein
VLLSTLYNDDTCSRSPFRQLNQCASEIKFDDDTAKEIMLAPMHYTARLEQSQKVCRKTHDRDDFYDGININRVEVSTRNWQQ